MLFFISTVLQKRKRLKSEIWNYAKACSDGGTHLRCVAPGNAIPKKRRCGGHAVCDLTNPSIEP